MSLHVQEFFKLRNIGKILLKQAKKDFSQNVNKWSGSFEVFASLETRLSLSLSLYVTFRSLWKSCVWLEMLKVIMVKKNKIEINFSVNLMRSFNNFHEAHLRSQLEKPKLRKTGMDVLLNTFFSSNLIFFVSK